MKEKEREAGPYSFFLHRELATGRYYCTSILHRYDRTGRDATPAVARRTVVLVRFVTVTHADGAWGLHFTGSRPRARRLVFGGSGHGSVARRRREMRATRARGWFAWLPGRLAEKAPAIGTSPQVAIAQWGPWPRQGVQHSTAQQRGSGGI